MPLQVRLYSSVLAGVSDEDALGSTDPMVQLAAHKLHYKIQLGLTKGETEEDLRAFGKELDSGVCHVGAIWGLEYGWLQQEFPRLEPLIVLLQQETRFVSQFLVRSKDHLGGEFATLKGKRLALYRGIPLMDRAYLAGLLHEGETVNTYFKVEKDQRYETVVEAINAVCDEEADCVLVNIEVYSHQLVNRPGLRKQLRAIVPSEPFPPAALIGRRERLNQIRPRLWEDLQETLEAMDQSAEGKECRRFWRVERFARPEHANLDFQAAVQKSLGIYPVTLLRKLPQVAPP